MQGGCGAAVTYIYIHIFSMQCKLYSITSPTAFWAPWKLRDGERESKWQFSQRAKKVLSLSPLVSTEKTSNAASVMYSRQGGEKKKKAFSCKPLSSEREFWAVCKSTQCSVEKSKIEPWGSGPEAAIQQAGSVPWRTQSSPARCELRASQNKPVTVTGGGYMPLGCHIQSLFVEVTSSVLQQRSPSTVHSLQGPHHNRSAARQRDMKVQYPWLLGLILLPTESKQILLSHC